MLSQIPITKAMSTEVIYLNPLDTFDKAKLLFEENNIHHIPVIDENKKVLGMISKSEYHALCDRFTLFSEAIGNKVNNSYFTSLLAREVMSQPAVSLNQSENLETAVNIFEKNLMHAVTIVNDDDEMVGILSSTGALTYLHHVLKGCELQSLIHKV